MNRRAHMSSDNVGRQRKRRGGDSRPVLTSTSRKGSRCSDWNSTKIPAEKQPEASKDKWAHPRPSIIKARYQIRDFNFCVIPQSQLMKPFSSFFHTCHIERSPSDSCVTVPVSEALLAASSVNSLTSAGLKSGKNEEKTFVIKSFKTFLSLLHMGRAVSRNPGISSSR